MATMFRTQPIKIEPVEGLQNDVFFQSAAYDRPADSNSTQTQGPRAKRVSLSSTGSDNTFLPTPPDSPVFVELTTAGQDIKVNLTKQNKAFQEGTQAVPNLEMNPSFNSDFYSMNTVYSPFQTTSPFYEGISNDDPLGASDNVLVKQELQDTFPDVFSNTSLDLAASQFMEHTNVQQLLGYANDPVFEAPAPPEYSHSIPSPTSTSSFDSIDATTGNCYQPESLPDFTHFTNAFSREHLNSGGEEDNFDSDSEASFTLKPVDSDDDSLDDISPFDPNDPTNYLLTSGFNPHMIRPRTHPYKINTVNQNVSTLKRAIPTIATSQQNPIQHKKPRGRPKKHIPNFGDGTGAFGQPARRGRGRRDAMKGNHLWEFIRDLLKNAAFCPKIIRWEEKDEGVFRFVNSEAVASMWGKKKNNPAMTYEKLSRAMRYYYKRDILERVDGRRLVYKFGKKAFGWEQAAGITTTENIDSTVAPVTMDSAVEQDQK